MNDIDIKAFLISCVEAEMEVLAEKSMQGCDYDYSRRYSKKLKRLLWSEKYFGKKLKLGYAVRCVAVIAVVLLSLLTVNEVSAKAFGFNPWKCVMSFLYSNKMDAKIYKERSDGAELLGVARDIPDYVPENFKQTTYEKDDHSLYVEWRMEERAYLQYIRRKIEVGALMAMDGEYESREKLELRGYSCYYCTKGNESWLVWDDKVYNHILFAIGEKESQNALIKMAESLYD